MHIMVEVTSKTKDEAMQSLAKEFGQISLSKLGSLFARALDKKKNMKKLGNIITENNISVSDVYLLLCDKEGRFNSKDDIDKTTKTMKLSPGLQNLVNEYGNVVHKLQGQDLCVWTEKTLFQKGIEKDDIKEMITELLKTPDGKEKLKEIAKELLKDNNAKNLLASVQKEIAKEEEKQREIKSTIFASADMKPHLGFVNKLHALGFALTGFTVFHSGAYLIENFNSLNGAMAFGLEALVAYSGYKFLQSGILATQSKGTKDFIKDYDLRRDAISDNFSLSGHFTKLNIIETSFLGASYFSTIAGNIVDASNLTPAIATIPYVAARGSGIIAAIATAMMISMNINTRLNAIGRIDEFKNKNKIPTIKDRISMMFGKDKQIGN